MKPATASDNASGLSLSRPLASAALKGHRRDHPADAAPASSQMHEESVTKLRSIAARHRRNNRDPSPLSLPFLLLVQNAC